MDLIEKITSNFFNLPKERQVLVLQDLLIDIVQETREQYGSDLARKNLERYLYKTM